MEQGRNEKEDNGDNGSREVWRVAIKDEYVWIIDVGVIFGHGVVRQSRNYRRRLYSKIEVLGVGNNEVEVNEAVVRDVYKSMLC
jgi:hypothetical protein